MNLIYIIDNYYFNDTNLFIFYTIIRWIYYDLVNIIYSKNKLDYNEVIFFKTYPSLSIAKINLNKENIILIILLLLNTTVFQKYNSYPIENFDDVLEQLLPYSDINHKIIYLTAINRHGFTKEYKTKLNSIFDQFKNKIFFCNIGIYPFFKNIFNNVNEIFINYKSIQTKDIISPTIFNINHINYDILEDVKTELDYIKILIEQIDKLIESKNNQVELVKNYVNLLRVFELALINIQKIKNYSNEYLELIEKFFKLNLINCIDKKIFAIINNFKNNLLKIYNSNCLVCPVKVPITLQFTSNIKYILEFYQEIYPKLIKFHIDSNTKNIKIKNISTSLINQNDIIKIQNTIINNISDQSIEYFVSNVTMTNWIDEYNELNPFGILIKYNLSRHSFKGIIDGSSSILFSYPNMVVSSVSTNWISMYDYYQMVLADLNINNNDNNIDSNNFDNKQNKPEKDILDLNNFNIIDNLNGDTNIMLPIYINKQTWKLVKLLWTYHLTFINASFEYEYNKKMDNIYYFTFIKCFNQFNSLNGFNNSLVRLFVVILRTCIQITIDNKYIGSINNEFDKIYKILLDSVKINKNPIDKYNYFKSHFSDFLIKLIQIIICNHINFNDIKKYIFEIRSVFLNLYLVNMFNKDFWNNYQTLSIENKQQEKNVIINDFIIKNEAWFKLENDLICISELVCKIYSILNFNQFIKYIDSKNTCIPIGLTDGTINCELIKNIYNSLENKKEFNVDYYFTQISIDDYI